MIKYQKFIDSLTQPRCPTGLEPCLQALWHDAIGDWNSAHDIVQRQNDLKAARIHAYLHREEGDDWNSRYWHQRAGTRFPENISIEEEWQMLVKQLTVLD